MKQHDVEFYMVEGSGHQGMQAKCGSAAQQMVPLEAVCFALPNHLLASRGTRE
jgi:hypothetical protein